MISNKNILFSELQNNSATIRSFGVERIGVFGSFIRNAVNDKSDVDVLVEFIRGGKNYDNLFSLHSFLEALTERKVEIVTRESLSPYIGPHIIREVEYVPFRN